jgi:hypothetical protein
VPHINGKIKTESVRKLGAEIDIWAEKDINLEMKRKIKNPVLSRPVLLFIFH